MAMTDLMSLTEFQDELRRVARFDVTEPLASPLTVAVQRIRDNPAFAQSRLLGRILHALAHQSGEFRRAEVSSFDAAHLRLVVALMNAARAGTHTQAEWLDAAAAADSAGAA